MARIVVRCQYTGHYVLTGIESRPDAPVAEGHVFCPYCTAEHVWTCNEARLAQARPNKALVRQAS